MSPSEVFVLVLGCCYLAAVVLGVLTARREDPDFTER